VTSSPASIPTTPSRGEDSSKKLNLSADDLRHFHPSEEDEHASTVFPDVMVHQRGRPGSAGGNLIVIEMKNTSSNDDGTFDKNVNCLGIARS
jgi:hypothetical protein